MANNIKGITIEIGGETTKLDQALKNVNKETRSLKNELKEIDKALKLDPKNTELLAQKQKVLAESIEATKDKLKTLKEAEEQARKAFEAGELPEEQYRALQREIVNTETELKNLEATAKKAHGSIGQTLQEAGSKIQKVGDGMQAAGQKLMPVTAAITGIGAAAIASAKDLDQGYDTIITKTGATGKAAEELKGQMDRIFADIPTDAQTAGTAIGEVNTRFGLTGDALGDLSEEFIKFAEINDTDVNNSIDSVDAIMTKFNVDVKDTGKVLGLMTKAGQDTGLSMDDLYRSLETNGATLKEMGLGLEESINLLAQFEASGVDSSTALSALRKAQQNATKEGKTLDEALNEQIEAIKGASSETEALQIATELFGKKGAAEMTQAIREGRFSVEDLSASLNDYADTVNDTYNATLDPWDQLKVATNNLKISGAELAGTILNMLQPAINTAVDKVKVFAEWFKNLDDSQKQMIVKIGAIVAAIGPALIVGGKITSTVGKITSGIGGLISKVGSLSGAAGGLSGALGALASPVGIVIAAIAALAAGFVYLYKTNDEFREKVNATVERVKKSFSDMVQKVKPLLNSLKAAFDNLMKTLQPVFEFLMTYITSFVNGIMKAAPSIISAVTNVVNYVTNILQAWISLFSGDFDGFLEHMKAAFQNAIDFVKNILTAWGQFFVGFFEGFGIDIPAIFSNIFTAITTTFQNIGAWFTEKFTAARTGIETAFKNIGQWFSDRWTDIKTALSTVATWFLTMFQNAYNNVVNVWKAIGQWFAARWTDIKTALSTVATWFLTMFQNAYNNVVNVWKAIGSWFSARYNDIKNAIAGIPELFRSTFQSAYDKITGIFKGIGDWFRDNVINKIKSLFEGLDLSGAGQKVINSFINAIKSVHLPSLSVSWSEIEKTIGDVTIKIPVPHISWNALGGIFTNPAIFGMAGGKLQGVGEAGPEAVLPLDTFYRTVEDYINDAVSRTAAAVAGQQAKGSGDFIQNNNYYSPKAIDAVEAARQTRIATRNMVLRLQGGNA